MLLKQRVLKSKEDVMYRKLVAAGIFFFCFFSIHAEKVFLNFRFNTLAEDKKNCFFWSVPGKSVKDGFDVLTGASKAHSTTEFDAARYDTSGKLKALPAGLRCLMLFAVSSFDSAAADALTVVSDEKKITISFIHRGTAYKITTDGNGVIDTDASFMFFKGAAENKDGEFILKDDIVKKGGDAKKMSDADWRNIPLAADTYDENAADIYSGKLTARYVNGILTVKGSLKKQIPPETELPVSAAVPDKDASAQTK